MAFESAPASFYMQQSKPQVTRPEVHPLPKAAGKKIIVAGHEIEVWNDELFSRLREDHGVENNFLAGLRLGAQLPKISKGKEPLFRTDDEEFIIKAMNIADHESMLDLTNDYVTRCLEGSLLCPIYLHFRFAVRTGRRFSKRGPSKADLEAEEHSEHLEWIAFIAMRNLTPNVGTWRARYDLKGCDDDKTLENEGQRIKAIHRRFWHFWYARPLWSEERWVYWHSKQDAKQFRLPMPPRCQRELVATLERDTQWLISQGLMDYSLLVGIQRFREEPAFANEDLPMVRQRTLSSESSSVPLGRPNWTWRETEVDIKMVITLQSREELERNAVKRITAEMEARGLNPKEWEYEMEGVDLPPPASYPGGDGTSSAGFRRPITPRAVQLSPVATFPRQFEVRLLKKTRDRPVCMVSVCIIDFLQTWTRKKKLAAYAKCAEPNRATVPPEEYGTRFLEHFKRRIQADPALSTHGVSDGPSTRPVIKPYSHAWTDPGYG